MNNGRIGNGRNGNGRNGLPPRAALTHRRRREGRRRSTRAKLLALAAVALVALVAAGVAALAGGGYATYSRFRGSCSLGELRAVPLGRTSFVYARDGALLGAIGSDRNREPLRLGKVSPWLQRATVAVEDRRFHEHDGLDYEGIARAAMKNFSAGRIVEGGSTITQQLVRSLYVGSERSWERKAKEACLALELEEAWSKERILEAYLNRVFYGNKAYGAQAAARTYFAKSASKLGPAEAALLAGLPQAPSLYDPYSRPKTAVWRRNHVLRAMRDAGFLTEARYERLVRKRLRLQRGKIYTRVREPYFFAYVRQQLIEKYGVSRVRNGGLRVHTTVDLRLQRRARAAIARTLDRRGDPASAIVAINPRTGAIRAMTAVARGRKGLQFNLAAQGRRQAGSAFKTFALAEAIRQGINPYRTRYLSAPFTYDSEDLPEPWEVTTYSHDYYGPSAIAEATLRSDNTVYARLTLDVGPGKVARRAARMGIQTKLEPVASIGLGSNSVSPLEMASAYATLAAGGVHRTPFAITKVEFPRGKVDAAGVWGRRGQRRVLTDGQAYEVTRILERNIQSGTGTGAAIGRPAAGKTGTTDEWTDAWFVGYVPQLATAVWVGYPDRARQMTNVHGIRVAGGTFPATIWQRFMAPAVAPLRVRDWPPPATPAVWRPFDGKFEWVPPPPPPPPPPAPSPAPSPAQPAPKPGEDEEKKKKDKPKQEETGGDEKSND